MTKNIQEHINIICVFHFNEAMKELYTNKVRQPFDKERLRNCTAWVYDVGEYYLLKSYNTFIACVEKGNGNTYDVLRLVYGYTSTSNQHICKFAEDYGNGQKYTYRKI